jgi:hypothetical protein
VRYCYDDILSRIAEEPIWFDENAVPRYCEFHPSKIASGDEVALVEVTCQSCGRLFRVAFAASAPAMHSQGEWPIGPIGRAIREKSLHYGDPPNVWCCPAGPTENSEPRKVVEYWRQGDPKYVQRDAMGLGLRITDPRAYFAWTRYPSFEIDIRPDWILSR